MIKKLKNKRISDIFKVHTGDYHATAELDFGNVPLISCGDTNNGLVGFFSIPRNKTYENTITVAYNGQPLTAKFHPYRFGAKDDVAVLLPRSTLNATTLFYIATMFNRMKWRYSYGRKCFRNKLVNVHIPIPITRKKGIEVIDEGVIEKAFPYDYRTLLPEKQSIASIEIPRIRWKQCRITDVFNLERGHFHSLAVLDAGSCMTVSRLSEDNGVVGHYEPPEGAEIYPRGFITVSTVGGDAFVQLDNFIATDNVIVFKPIDHLRPTTLHFLAFILNRQKWRYSYGRQCYLTKLKQACLHIPLTREGNIAEDIIQQVVEQTSYWQQIKRRFRDE